MLCYNSKHHLKRSQDILERASLVAQMVKCLPAMREIWVQYLDQEDPLEKEMATHSSTLAWKMPWMEQPGRLQSMGSQKVGHDWVTSFISFQTEIKRCLLLGRKVMTNLDSILKSRDITLSTKVHLFKAMVFPVIMYGCESWTIKKSWAPNNWCFWTVLLEKTLENPLDCRKIQPVHSKDQSWVFIGQTDVEAETPVLWPPDEKSWLIWKDPDAGKDWGQEEKGTTEDEMVGWHHWLNGHEFG